MRLGINGFGQIERRLVERLESDSRFELAGVNGLAPVPVRPTFRGGDVPWFGRREPCRRRWEANLARSLLRPGALLCRASDRTARDRARARPSRFETVKKS